jgi:hypothetical protein
VTDDLLSWVWQQESASISFALVPLKAQSLRSHSVDFFIERVDFLVKPLVLRFRRIVTAYFLKRVLDGQFVDFSHDAYLADLAGRRI